MMGSLSMARAPHLWALAQILTVAALSAQDCNHDGILDADEVALGNSSDCDWNGGNRPRGWRFWRT
jgi:hypothetical protein